MVLDQMWDPSYTTVFKDGLNESFIKNNKVIFCQYMESIFLIIPNLLLTLLIILLICFLNLKLSSNIIPKSFIVRLAEISFSCILLYSMLGLFLQKCQILHFRPV